jgi:hypothetical protein
MYTLLLHTPTGWFSFSEWSTLEAAEAQAQRLRKSGIGRNISKWRVVPTEELDNYILVD